MINELDLFFSSFPNIGLRKKERNENGIINNSYVHITDDQRELFSQFVDSISIKKYKKILVLVHSVESSKKILEKFEYIGLKVQEIIEHKNLIGEFSPLDLNSIDIIITMPKIVLHLLIKWEKLLTKFGLIIIYEANRVFDEYCCYGWKSFMKIFHQNTSYILFSSKLSFHFCSFCKRFLSNIKISGELEKCAEYLIFHRTRLLSLENKISFLYETFTNYDRIVVITSSQGISELLYGHFQNIKVFENQNISIFKSNQLDTSNFSHSRHIIFVDIKFFEKNLIVHSDVFIVFNFSFHYWDYIILIESISKNHQFCLFYNLVEIRDMKLYLELKEKYQKNFENEEIKEYTSILSEEENETVSRSMNADLYKSFDQLLSDNGHDNFSSEYELIRLSLRKSIDFSIVSFPEYMLKNSYYVDKSRFLEPFFNDYDSILFTRPRKFGKSLNLSMIKTFFECHPDMPNYSHLFSSLSISRHKDVHQYQGKYPVILLSFSNFKSDCSTFNEFKKEIGKRVAVAFRYHNYCTISLDEHQHKQYLQYSDPEGTNIDSFSLHTLSSILLSYHRKYYYGSKVIVLVDDYDLPLHNAFEKEYYEEAIMFLISFYGWVAKGNSDIHFCLFVGVVKAQLNTFFTGVDNMLPSTILDTYRFLDFFGFNESEIDALLKYYNLFSRKSEVQSNYCGYQFSNHEKSQEIGNPFSVSYFVKTKKHDNYLNMIANHPYLRKSIQSNSEYILYEISQFLVDTGHTIDFSSDDLGSYLDSYGSIPLLFNTGFLTTCFCVPLYKYHILLCLTNQEIRNTYRQMFYSWFDISIEEHDLNEILIQGDILRFSESIERMLKRFLRLYETNSFLEDQTFRNLVSGILAMSQISFDMFYNTDNRESTVLILPLSKSMNGYFIEFKVSNTNNVTLKHWDRNIIDKLEPIYMNNHIPLEKPIEIGDTSILFNVCLVLNGRKIFAMYNTNKEGNRKSTFDPMEEQPK